MEEKEKKGIWCRFFRWTKKIWNWFPPWFHIATISGGFIALGVFFFCCKGFLDDPQHLQSVLLALVALATAPFAVWRMKITHKNFYTDSYIRAVEQLKTTKDNKKNEPNLEIRIGAIFGLEKIGYESKEHAYQVLGLLSSYVRQNARRLRVLNPPRDDIYTALKSIARLMIESRPDKNYTPNLRGVELVNTNLNGFDFKEFNFQEAHLEKADLRQAHLEKADLRQAHLEKADLHQAHLEGSDLTLACLKKTVFYEAHLEGAKLYDAYFEKTDFRHAHLKGVYLPSADLTRIDFRYAHLEEAILNHTILIGANIQRADLYKANLEGASLQWASFKKAQLWKTNLKGAYFEGTDLEEANLTGAKMETADNLTPEQIKSAFGDLATILPLNLEKKRPEHWPKRKLTRQKSYDEWKKWCRDKKNYNPPQCRLSIILFLWQYSLIALSKRGKK